MNEFLQDWLRHRNVLLELLDRISDEHTGFKPWEGAMSLGDLAIHIAASMDMFVQGVKTGTFSMSTATERFESMDQVRQTVREYTEKTKAAILELGEPQLERTIPFSQFKAPGKTWLRIALDHEIHHKGQLFVYARMIGVERLPFFIFQPPRKTETQQG